MNKQIIVQKLKEENPRSAWNRGVINYALDIIDYFPDDFFTGDMQKIALNGANDWHEYSESGNALIYDTDIIRRLCTKKDAEKALKSLNNSRKNWLHIQYRALMQAYRKIEDIAYDYSHKWISTRFYTPVTEHTFNRKMIDGSIEWIVITDDVVKNIAGYQGNDIYEMTDALKKAGILV